MATLYLGSEVREVPDSQVPYLTGQEASDTTGRFIPTPYSANAPISSPTPVQPTPEAIPPRPVFDSSQFEQSQSEILAQEQLGQLQAPTMRSEAEIREEALARARAQIEATEGLYQEELARVRDEGNRRTQGVSSMAVSAGLAGSPFKEQLEDPSRKLTQQQLNAQSAQRQAQIGAIMAQAEGQSQERFLKEREFYTGEQEKYKSEQERLTANIQAEQEARKLKARGIIPQLAAGGLSLDEIPQADFDKLLEESGLSELEARVLYNLNTPEAQADYSVQGSKLIGIFFDPITQKPKITTQDIPGLEGAEEVNIQQFGGVPYVIGTDAEGNVIGKILPGFQDPSKATGGRASSGSSISGFDLSSITPEARQVVQSIPTFEDFIKQKEEELQMSIADRESFRKEYESQIEPIIEQQKVEGNDLVGAYAEMVIKGQASLSSIPNSIRNEVAMRTQELGGAKKTLSETAIKEIAQTQNALDALVDLRSKIDENIEFIGPVSGLQALNPYSEARRIQADVDRVRQTVGKALEGGVLRKEDEEKYKKILATVTDRPETALYKIDQLLKDIQSNYDVYLSSQASADRYVGGFETQQQTQTSASSDPLGIR
jgi:hypothetical protein